MPVQKIQTLGELKTAGAATAAAKIGGYDDLGAVIASQVSAVGQVTSAVVELEYSLDGVGWLPLQSIELTSSVQSDGALGVNTIAAAVRMRLVSITGTGSVIGTVVKED